MTGPLPPPDPSDVAALAAARARVLERIARACAVVRRDPAEVTLLAVSKTVPPTRLRAAVAAGLARLAENRVQEAAEKAPIVPGASWTLVGPLQSNKARRALEVFEAIETLDSVELALRLDRLAAEVRPGGPVPVLLEVNVDADPAKAGFTPMAVERALPELAALPNLRVEGLMTIGRLEREPEAARPTFRALRELSERLRSGHRSLGPALSMGMTDDYEVAVEEGATIVRIGRALFGERHPAGG